MLDWSHSLGQLHSCSSVFGGPEESDNLISSIVRGWTLQGAHFIEDTLKVIYTSNLTKLIITWSSLFWPCQGFYNIVKVNESESDLFKGSMIIRILVDIGGSWDDGEGGSNPNIVISCQKEQMLFDCYQSSDGHPIKQTPLLNWQFSMSLPRISIENCFCRMETSVSLCKQTFLLVSRGNLLKELLLYIALENTIEN